MATKKMTPRSGNYSGANGATAHSCGETLSQSLADGWTRAQCRAIEIGIGGGFVLLAALEVMFGW